MNVHTGADAGGTHGNDTKTQTNECPHGGGRRRRARQRPKQMKVHTEADAGAGHGKDPNNETSTDETHDVQSAESKTPKYEIETDNQRDE